METYITNPEEQRRVRRYLKEAQQFSPNPDKIGEDSSANVNPKKMRKLRHHIRVVSDGAFIILIAVGILKDIFDFFALALFGNAEYGAGLIFPVVLSIMFQILMMLTLLLQNSGVLGKTITRLKVMIAVSIFQFLCGYFLGLSWIPEATASAMFLYYIVLRGRRRSAFQELSFAQNET